MSAPENRVRASDGMYCQSMPGYPDIAPVTMSDCCAGSSRKFMYFIAACLCVAFLVIPMYAAPPLKAGLICVIFTVFGSCPAAAICASIAVDCS